MRMQERGEGDRERESEQLWNLIWRVQVRGEFLCGVSSFIEA